MIFLLLFGGCATPNQTASPTPADTTEATATPVSTPAFSVEEFESASKLLDNNGHIPDSELSKKENGPHFVVLALASDSNEQLVSALRGLRKTYTADRAYPKTNKSNPRVAEAISRNLSSTQDTVLCHAIRASVVVLGKNPDPIVAERLSDLATSSPDIAARFEALDALMNIKGFLTKPDYSAVRKSALADDAPTAGLLLDAYLSKGVECPEELNSTLQHIDPGVRSRGALLFFDQLKDADKEKKFLQLLGDKQGVVRAAALVALDQAQSPSLPAHLATLKSDDESCIYPIKFTDLMGKTQSVPSPELPGTTVSEVAKNLLKKI